MSRLSEDGRRLAALRAEARTALRHGDLGPADALLSRGATTLEDVTHELRVHQVELEMQASELREVNARLESSLGRFRQLFELLPHPALVLDGSGRVLEANARAEEELGLARRSVVSPAPLRRSLPDPGQQGSLHAAISSADARGRARMCDVRVTDARGGLRRMDLSLERLADWDDSGETRLLAQLVDQTEVRTLHARFATVLDGAMDGILSVDGDLRIHVFNPAAERIFGWKAADVRGKHLDLLLAADLHMDRAELLAAFADPEDRPRRVGRGRRIFGRRASGERFAMEASVSRARPGPDGEPSTTVVVRDVTERAEAEEALAESESRFRQVTESMSEVFWLLDRNSGRLLYLSPAVAALWPALAGAQTPMFEDLVVDVPEDDRAAMCALLDPGADGVAVEHRVTGRNGTVRWLHHRAVAVRGSGSDGGRVAGIATDITEQRANSERIRLLEAAVDRINDVVLVTATTPSGSGEPHRVIAFVNDAFERVTGYTAAEVLGRDPRMLHGPDTDPGEAARVSAAIQRREPVTAELLHYRRDGTPYLAETETVPLSTDDGGTTLFVSVERDVTQRRSAEARERRRDKLASLGQLTGGVAHDFNNILAIVLGNAELLADELGDRPGLLQLTRLIGDAATRGSLLTRRLLSFAQRGVTAMEAHAVRDLIREAEPLVRRTLAGEVSVAIRRDGASAHVLVDAGQFENALLNLCINARDAMPEGGRIDIVTDRVTLGPTARSVEGLEPGDYASVVVSDTGEGIPEAHLERIFDPFFTTKEMGGGTGLGLAMVYGFVRQSSGEILVRSRVGEGTTFEILLPCTDPPARRERELSGDGGAVPRGDGEVVLVVEDDPQVRRLTARELGTLGYRVLKTASGEDALAVLAGVARVDLLLTDVMLPGGMNGGEVAEGAERLRPGMPVVFASGYAGDVLVERRRLAPGMTVLEKPYRRVELARALAGALKTYHST